MTLLKTEPDAAISTPPKSGKLQFQSAYSRFSLVLLIITAVTVVPSYFRATSADHGPVSSVLIAHAVLFLVWYILFYFQSALVTAGRFALHKKLGYLSVGLALLLAASGAVLMIGVMKGYDPGWSPEMLFSRTSFVWGIIHTLVSFTIFYCLGVFYRQSPDAHKRFLLLASLSMMSASITRVAYLPIIPIDGTMFTLLSTYALLITPLGIDRVVRGKIHPVLKWGAAIYAGTQILAIGLLPTTPVGRALAFPF